MRGKSEFLTKGAGPEDKVEFDVTKAEEFLKFLQSKELESEYLRSDQNKTSEMLLDKIDEILEYNIKNIEQFLKSEAPKNNDPCLLKIEERNVLLLRKTLEIVSYLCKKDQGGLYQGHDRLLDLIKLSSNFEVISLVFNIIFEYFSLTKSIEKPFNEREEDVIKLFYYCKFILDHRGGDPNNPEALNYTLYFFEDERFQIFLKGQKPSEIKKIDIMKSQHEPNALTYDFLNPPFGPMYGGPYKPNIFSACLKERKAFSVKIDDIKLKFGDLHFYHVAKLINEEYKLQLEENTPLFDCLSFRIRVVQQSLNPESSLSIVTSSLFAMTSFVSFLKSVEFTTNTQLINSIFTKTFNISLILKEILDLFYFKANPSFHLNVLKSLLGIFSMENIFNFKEYLPQITSQYNFLQKIIKDCTYKRIETVVKMELEGEIPSSEDRTVKADSKVLPEPSALYPYFLENLLLLIKKEIIQFFKDEESYSYINQIYSIPTLIDSLVSILETPISSDGICLLNFETLTIAAEILEKFLNHAEISRDFSLVEKFILRIESDLATIKTGTQIYNFEKNKWITVKTEKHIAFVNNLFKIILQPFLRNRERENVLNATSRKIQNSKIFELMKPVFLINKESLTPEEFQNTLKLTDLLFKNAILLVTHLCIELPNIVSQLVSNGVMEMLIKRALDAYSREKDFNNKFMNFLKVLCLVEVGTNLAIEKGVFDFIFNQVLSVSFFDPENIQENSNKVVEMANALTTITVNSETVRQKVMERLEFISNKLIESQTSVMSQVFEALQNPESKMNVGFNPKDADELNIITSGFVNFFAGFFNKNSKILKELFEKGGVDKYLKILTCPLYLLDKNLSASIRHFQLITIEAKHMGFNIDERISPFFNEDLKSMDTIIGGLEKNLDFSKFLSDESILALDQETGVANFIKVFEKTKMTTESAKLYFSIQKTRMHLEITDYLLHENQKINPEFIKSLPHLENFYKLVSNQQVSIRLNMLRADAEKLQNCAASAEESKAHETAKKNFFNQSKYPIKEYLMSLKTLRKIIYCAIESTVTISRSAENLQALIEYVANLLTYFSSRLKLTRSGLSANEKCKPQNQEILVTALLNDYLYFTNIQVLLEVVSDLKYPASKTIYNFKFYDILHRNLVYEALLSYVIDVVELLKNNKVLFSDQKDKEEAVVTFYEQTIKEFSFKIFGKTNGLICHLFAHPIDISLPTILSNGKKLKVESLVEYTNGILDNQTKLLEITIKKLIDDLTVCQTLGCDVQKYTRELFEALLVRFAEIGNIRHVENKPKPNQSKSRGMFSGLRNHLFDLREDLSQNSQGIRTIMEQMISEITSMGITRERAELACSNIEFPSVEAALEWIFTHPEESEKRDINEEVQMNVIIEEEGQEAENKLEPLKLVHIYKGFLLEENIYLIDKKTGLEAKKMSEPLNDSSYRTSIFKSYQNIMKELIFKFFSLKGAEYKITDFLKNILSQEKTFDKVKTIRKDLIFIIFDKIKVFSTHIFKKISMKNPFKPETKELQDRLQNIMELSPEDNSLKQLNILLQELFLRLSVQVCGANMVLKGGLELLKIMEKVVDLAEDYTASCEGSSVDTNQRDVLEDHIYIQTLIINEMIKTLSSFEFQAFQKSLKNRIELEKNSAEEESQYKKQALFMIIGSLSVSNKHYAKQKSHIINLPTLEGFLSLVIKICKKAPEYSKFFIEKKGFVELFKLQHSNNSFSKLPGILELVTALAEAMIVDDDFLCATGECEIKKLINDHVVQGNIIPVEELKKKLTDSNKVVLDKIIGAKPKVKSEEESKESIEIQENIKAPNKGNLQNQNLYKDLELSRITTVNISEQIKAGMRKLKNKDNPFSEGESAQSMHYLPKAHSVRFLFQLIKAIITQLGLHILENNKAFAAKEAMITEEKSSSKFLFSYHYLLYVFQVLVRKYQLLVPFFLKNNCLNILNKIFNQEGLNFLLGTSVQSISFINFLVRVLPMFTVNKFKNLIFELCLDSSILYKSSSKATGPITYKNYAHQVRKRILKDIRVILNREVHEQNDKFLQNPASIHIFTTYSGLLTSLLPITEVSKLCIQIKTSEERKQYFNFGKIYVSALKSLKIRNTYQLEDVTPFILEPLSILYQHSIALSVGKLVQSNNEDPINAQIIKINMKLWDKDRDFAREWEQLMNPSINDASERGSANEILRGHRHNVYLEAIERGILDINQLSELGLDEDLNIERLLRERIRDNNTNLMDFRLLVENQEDVEEIGDGRDQEEASDIEGDEGEEIMDDEEQEGQQANEGGIVENEEAEEEVGVDEDEGGANEGQEIEVEEEVNDRRLNPPSQQQTSAREEPNFLFYENENSGESYGGNLYERYSDYKKDQDQQFSLEKILEIVYLKTVNLGPVFKQIQSTFQDCFRSLFSKRAIEAIVIKEGALSDNILYSVLVIYNKLIKGEDHLMHKMNQNWMKISQSNYFRIERFEEFRRSDSRTSSDYYDYDNDRLFEYYIGLRDRGEEASAFGRRNQNFSRGYRGFMFNNPENEESTIRRRGERDRDESTNPRQLARNAALDEQVQPNINLGRSSRAAQANPANTNQNERTNERRPLANNQDERNNRVRLEEINNFSNFLSANPRLNTNMAAALNTAQSSQNSNALTGNLEQASQALGNLSSQIHEILSQIQNLNPAPGNLIQPTAQLVASNNQILEENIQGQQPPQEGESNTQVLEPVREAAEEENKMQIENVAEGAEAEEMRPESNINAENAVPQNQASNEEESTVIDFEALGLDPNFLQKNNIDPIFFAALSDDLKMDIILQYLPRDQSEQNQNSNNAGQPILIQEEQKIQQEEIPRQEALQQVEISSPLISNENLGAQDQASQQNISAVTQEQQGGGNQALLNSDNTSLNIDGNQGNSQEIVGAVEQQAQSLGNNNENIVQPQRQQGQNVDNIMEAFGDLLEPISEDFLNALPEATRLEVLEQRRRDIRELTGGLSENVFPEVRPGEIDNETFLVSLTPELREEALLTCNEEFLRTLPQEIQDEARRLRDRRAFGSYRYPFGGNRPQGQNLGRGIGGANPNNNNQPKTNLKELREKEMNERKGLAKTISEDEKLLEAVLKLLYSDSKSFSKFPYLILRSLIVNPVNEFKVLDFLLFLLKEKDLGEYLPRKNFNDKIVSEKIEIENEEEEEFPLTVLYERDSLIRSYPKVYSLISLKILYLLNRIARSSFGYHYFMSKEDSTNTALSSILECRKFKKPILEGEINSETYPFFKLISLLSFPKITESPAHLQLLISVIFSITEKWSQYQESKELIDLKSLNPEIARSICQVIPNNNLVSEESLKKLSKIITSFCMEGGNFEFFIMELNQIISIMSEFLNKNLSDVLNRLSDIHLLIEFKKKSKESLDDVKFKEEVKKFLSCAPVIEALFEFEAKIEEESKIVRVFKIMGQLYEKTTARPKQSEASEANQENEKLLNDIRTSFHNLTSSETLRNLWVNLSELLNILHIINNSTVNVVNSIVHKLQPIMECYFLLSKIIFEESAQSESTGALNLQRNDSQSQSKLVELALETSESNNKFDMNFDKLKETPLDREQLFMILAEKNKTIINKMVRQNPNLLNESFSMILKKIPHILDFQNKRGWFAKQLKDRSGGYHHYGGMRLKLRRNQIFNDSFHQLKNYDTQSLKGDIRVEFQNEEGMDAGGLTKEWFTVLAREIFNPDYALFIPSANKVTYQPNPLSRVNPDHLLFFKFVGRVIGKALYDGRNLECFFTRSFYKHMLGRSDSISLNDLEDIDPDVHKNLAWLLQNDVSILELTFSYDKNDFGAHKTVDLIPNGRNAIVTESNKAEYVKLMCSERMVKAIQEQIKAFMEGFNELIPKALVSIFEVRELELMISGLPYVDVQDLKENAEYNGYTRDSKVIKWFWEILESMDQNDRTSFLQFVTATSKVPLDGFKGLKHKFTIHKSFEVNKLPLSHTCFNQLDLPDYSSKEILEKNLIMAIREGKEGFAFR